MTEIILTIVLVVLFILMPIALLLDCKRVTSHGEEFIDNELKEKQ